MNKISVITYNSRYTTYRFGLAVISSLLCLSIAILNTYNYFLHYPDAGEPLYLTPLIKAGYIDEAKVAARVVPLAGNIESYSGYLTVDDLYSSNLFFWFFIRDKNAPIILWLQGGPGASSLFGLFSEHGPFIIDDNFDVKLRQYAWTDTCSVLYIDNPVGTGYSFTKHEEGYARNETDVAKNLYVALLQLFTMFPEFRNNDFFIAGESYAGKYVPAISYMIHQRNPSAEIKINFRGLAIGNGLCDPEHMLHYSEYLYQLGLIDKNAKDIFHTVEMQTLSYIKQQKWLEAFEIFNRLLNGDLGVQTLFTNITGLTNYYNYLDKGDKHSVPIDKFIQQVKIRKNIHVGNLTFNDGVKVEFYLREDIMKSVTNWIEVLIENYRTLIYNGQLDIIVAYPLTVEFLNNLNWSGSNLYKTAPRKIWMVNNSVAGYSKTVKKFTEVLVRDAGHMVPADQPLFAFDLINRFVFDEPF